MIFARFIAVVLLLQGVGPALLFGVWRPGGWFLACLATIYAFLTVGLWQGRRWALPLAFALTLPQLFVFSSSWFSWRFYVFASRGFGVAPADTLMQVPLFTYRSFGGCLNFAFGYSQPLIADYVSTGHQSFVLLNVLAIPLLALLLLHLAIKLIAAESSPVPNHALQRTEAGEGVSSVPDT